MVGKKKKRAKGKQRAEGEQQKNENIRPTNERRLVVGGPNTNSYQPGPSYAVQPMMGERLANEKQDSNPEQPQDQKPRAKDRRGGPRELFKHVAEEIHRAYDNIRAAKKKGRKHEKSNAAQPIELERLAKKKEDSNPDKRQDGRPHHKDCRDGPRGLFKHITEEIHRVHAYKCMEISKLVLDGYYPTAYRQCINILTDETCPDYFRIWTLVMFGRCMAPAGDADDYYFSACVLMDACRQEAADAKENAYLFRLNELDRYNQNVMHNDAIERDDDEGYIICARSASGRMQTVLDPLIDPDDAPATRSMRALSEPKAPDYWEPDDPPIQYVIPDILKKSTQNDIAEPGSKRILERPAPDNIKRSEKDAQRHDEHAENGGSDDKDDSLFRRGSRIFDILEKIHSGKVARRANENPSEG